MTDPLAHDTSGFFEIVRRRERGKLKVYVGSAAGTGKTYRMLQEAHDLRRRGVDVVVGFVETHGRAETEAQIRDLEVVPRKPIAYRNVTLEEMDLDAIIAGARKWCSWTSWRTPTSRGRGTASDGRTPSSCSTRGSTSCPP